MSLTRNTSSIVGIDLGTTNSLVAYVKNGVPTVLHSSEGGRLVPSVVSFAGGAPMVGSGAKRLKVRDAQHTVVSVKRLLGRGLEDLQQAQFSLPYRLVHREGLVGIDVGGRIYTPIEISAMILKKLKSSAEQALGVPITRTVITVPAYFNDSQRQATRAAGRLAGLDVLRIINEPTAASLAYGLDRKRQGLIAVYDLGGGTFDISILKLHDGIFEVLSTHGDTALGGDDLDHALVNIAVSEVKARDSSLDPLSDAQTHASFLEAAEAVKIALSDQDEAIFEVPGYRRKFTRAEFELLARPILERTFEPCRKALTDAGLGASNLSDVVLVGGPTRLRIVREVAREIFGREPNVSLHPDEVVALGASIQADILAGNNRELLLLDVAPLSLGLETYGGLMSPLISRNTKIPAVARETFTTFVDHQTGVDIHVLQGERERVEDNRSLARFKLTGIEPAPAGFPRIEVTFLVDADGILNVAAKNLKTGHEQSVEVRPSYGLTDAEIERMLVSGAENAEQDVAYRALVETRNEAEAVLRASEGKLADARRLLPEPEAQAILGRIENLRKVLLGADPEKIREASFHLNQATVRLAELLVKEAIALATSTR